MSSPANDEVVAQVDRIGATPFSGLAYRYTATRRDPLSGAGARLFGGRWNPRGIYAATYLAIPESACMGELDRAAASQGMAAVTFLEAPKTFHSLTVTNLPVLDLRAAEMLEQVGLTMDDIAGDEWDACQSVGHAAWFLEFGGVLAPSATGRGYVLAAFEDRVEPGSIAVVTSAPLNPTLYNELSAGAE
ncbi:RES family NAD+ phosphorylase [Arthrobacter tumbae]|uniref:RES domain-containing protein n=1 Tax=Arthrobacter tumbae TaxID=163874 RepID=UPI001957CB7E|nr:RES domain-containing protein [Arthrobacter tumbae]